MRKYKVCSYAWAFKHHKSVSYIYCSKRSVYYFGHHRYDGFWTGEVNSKFKAESIAAQMYAEIKGWA